MARLTKEQLNELKEKHGVDRIWSYSRINLFHEQPWCYRMAYLDEARVRTDNIYSYFGSLAHDLIQDAYDGKHTVGELPEKYDEVVTNWRLVDSVEYSFMNEKVEKGYIDNLKHYFGNVELLPYKLQNEKPVKTVFKKNGRDIVFIGYIDSIYKDAEGNICILDYKTSSKSGFTGKQLKAHSKQLMLYAIGVHQATGVPYDKIKPRYDMMKYVNVEYLQKNGKWKKSLQERVTWVASQESKIRKLLSDNGCDILEIDNMILDAVTDNNLSSLPDFVQDKFRVSQAYIELTIDEDSIKEVEEWFVSNVLECERKEAGDWEVEFPEPIIDESNEFYFNVLAKQMLPYHRGWREKQLLKQAINETPSVNDLDDLFL